MPEIVEPDEFRFEAERVLAQHRLVKRLARRPVEEHQRDGELRRQQQVGQHLVREDDAWRQAMILRLRGWPIPSRTLPAGREAQAQAYKDCVSCRWPP